MISNLVQVMSVCDDGVLCSEVLVETSMKQYELFSKNRQKTLPIYRINYVIHITITSRSL